MAQIFFRVKIVLKIRRAPSLGAIHDGNLSVGQVISTDSDTRTEAEGYVWYQHALGWSAEKETRASGEVFLVQIDPEQENGPRGDAVNTNTVSTIRLPSGNTLPRPDLFKQHPLAIEKVEWSQYFGNTRFAFNLSNDRSEKRRRMYFYSQGLHAGLDYGNSGENVPVRAGVDGKISQIVRNASVYAPGFVRVRSGDFTIIYGHMGNIPSGLRIGDNVNPETLLGSTEPTQEHLHLEVRYRDTWIINPLVFMPPALANAFIAVSPSFANSFYSDALWTRWQTPFDQPVLRLVNPAAHDLIGPRAARG